MQPFSLNNLTSTEFENFCFDLLGELGFINITWRKGTGLESSPSDSGRDIECMLEIVDIDGNKYFEKWFVECKHYVEGISPVKIQGVLSWAMAENPDKVLIIVSNFLSNPTKDYLSIYERGNRPKFKIKYWEKPDIEKLTLGKSRILKKYKIIGEFPYVQILHPAHLLYMKGLRFNSIKYLFDCLNNLDVEKRDHVMYWAYDSIIRPRYRESTHGGETLEQLRIDEVSYAAFKRKCYQIIQSHSISEIHLVFLIVSITLNAWISTGDTTSIDKSLSEAESQIKFLEQIINDEIALDADEYTVAVLEDKDTLRGLLAFMQEQFPKIEGNIQESYNLYEYFCENVVTRLLQEELFDNYREQMKKRYLARIKRPPINLAVKDEEEKD